MNSASNRPVDAPTRPGALERLLVAYARGFPVRRGKMRIVDGLWRTAAGENPHRLTAIRYGGLTMPCDLRESLQRQHYFFGTYFLEEEILDAWSAAAVGARTVFDIGANAGIYSLAALAAEPSADVHAFEPTPEIAGRLRSTAEMNRLTRLHVHETAVTDIDGEATLRRSRGDDGANEGMNFVVAGDDGPGSERVATMRLESFCAMQGIDHIDLLKMDIQGNEAAALAGANGLIADGRIGTIFMELNWLDEGSSECPATQSVAQLAAAGYLFAEPRRILRWRTAGPWLRNLSDIVARSPRKQGAEAP